MIERTVSHSDVTPSHEAAHVAAAWLLLGDAGIRGLVTIVPDGLTAGSSDVGPHSSGYALLEEAWSNALQGWPMPPAAWEFVQAEILVRLAGQAGVAVRMTAERFTVATAPTPAERTHIAAATARGEVIPEGDAAQVRWLLERITATPEEADALGAWFELRVERLAASELFRTIATAIAHELQVHRTISREKALRTIHYALGNPAQSEKGISA